MNQEVTVKPSNPKDALGIKKVPFHVVPSQVIGELGLALMEGARKYGSYNFRTIGVRGSVYFDAAERHLRSWWEGEDIDPDSGLSHVTKAIATLVVLRDAMMQGKFTDDRPPSVDRPWVLEMNEHAAKLIDKYPDPKTPFVKESNAN